MNPPVRISIPRWRPTPLNRMIGRHWTAVARLKADDRSMVAAFAKLQGAPPAWGPRRVDLHVTLSGRQQEADPDAYWKSLLDALVQAGQLIDDAGPHCVMGAVTYSRGTPAEAGSVITLIDIPTEYT